MSESKLHPPKVIHKAPEAPGKPVQGFLPGADRWPSQLLPSLRNGAAGASLGHLGQGNPWQYPNRYSHRILGRDKRKLSQKASACPAPLRQQETSQEQERPGPPRKEPGR
jgi:hypothetical protein